MKSALILKKTILLINIIQIDKYHRAKRDEVKVYVFWKLQ